MGRHAWRGKEDGNKGGEKESSTTLRSRDGRKAMTLLSFSRQLLTLFLPWPEPPVHSPSVSRRTARNELFTQCDSLHPELTARERAEVPVASQGEGLRHPDAESQR